MPSEEAPPAQPEIVIAAVGDVMMPASIQTFVKNNNDNYDLLFEKIAPDLAAADITVANLETPVDHTTANSGYPKFNAKPGLLAALKRAGVDIVSVANNHAMDAGTGGLRRTLENITAAGLLSIGAGKTKTETAEIRTMTVNTITAAFLGYTYSTNERLPGKKAVSPGLNILRMGSKTDLARAVEKVREAKQKADIVVVSLHWGTEYARKPTRWQKQAARALVEAGADIILGHHPHVLQPVETHGAQDGRQALIAYSLGNFISSQNYGVSHNNKNHSRALRGDGVILSVTVTKEAGKAAISHAEFLPLWTLRETAHGSVVRRPVSIARELSRLEAVPERSADDEHLMELLKHRQAVITALYAPPSAK